MFKYDFNSSSLADWMSWLQYTSWFKYTNEIIVVNQWEEIDIECKEKNR